MEMTDRDVKIASFAEQLKLLLSIFDNIFIEESGNEALLRETLSSLEGKISYNESAAVIIHALGGRYDSSLDRAKCEEAKALVKLLEARIQIRELTVEQAEEDTRNKDILKNVFGI